MVDGFLGPQSIGCDQWSPLSLRTRSVSGLSDTDPRSYVRSPSTLLWWVRPTYATYSTVSRTQSPSLGPNSGQSLCCSARSRRDKVAICQSGRKVKRRPFKDKFRCGNRNRALGLTVGSPKCVSWCTTAAFLPQLQASRVLSHCWLLKSSGTHGRS